VTRNIAIVLFENAEELDFVGPWEVFTMLSQVERDSCSVYTVSEKGGEVRCAKGMRVLADHSFQTSPLPDILVIPGGHGTRREIENEAMLSWVKQAAASAEISTSVCTGSFILHAAGLLEGRRATTHWASLDYLRGRGVDIVEERFVDEGNIITAAGVSAGIDMALHVVGRLWSPPIARKVQKAIEYFPEPPYADVPIPALR
jgi:transcriptional regulator GlxA family with amidase domain